MRYQVRQRCRATKPRHRGPAASVHLHPGVGLRAVLGCLHRGAVSSFPSPASCSAAVPACRGHPVSIGAVFFRVNVLDARQGEPVCLSCGVWQRWERKRKWARGWTRGMPAVFLKTCLSCARHAVKSNQTLLWYRRHWHQSRSSFSLIDSPAVWGCGLLLF